jgi:hypothetical protein
LDACGSGHPEAGRPRDTPTSARSADDGHWELEADLKSVRYDLHVDPKSGEITKSERDDD